MKVRLKEDINLKDLKENNWEGCMSWTLQFLEKYYDTKEEFEVQEYDEGSYKIYGTDIEEGYITVNKKCFEITEDKKIEKIDGEYFERAGINYKSTLLKEKLDELIDKINEMREDK